MSNEISTLGLIRNPVTDAFTFKIAECELSENPTKRAALSEIAKRYDPLGLLGPAIITAKVWIQQLWKHKLDWDEDLPIEDANFWKAYQQDILSLNRISIDRHVMIPNAVSIQLHGFADASEKAYGAAIYMRSSDGVNIKTRLLTSKSKVAPIKKETIPRLELKAALLLANLSHSVVKAIKINFDSITLWTDSTITLAWINTDSDKLKTFVGNRVARIQQITTKDQWRHVRTQDNPADLVSRGVMPSHLVSTTFWWNGPEFLNDEEDKWPVLKEILPEELPEMKLPKAVINTATQEECFIEKYSSFERLVRVVALCLRFANNLRHQDKSYGHITVSEKTEALKSIIKIVQEEAFANEIETLKKDEPVRQSSNLKSLAPFVDAVGVLRVGGRLENAELSYNAKHPVLLPSNHHFTRLVFDHFHKFQHHLPPTRLLNAVRQQFWPLNGKSTARKTVRNCVTCFRINPRYIVQQMGDLPEFRVQANNPFEHVGVDFAGPFQIKIGSRRNSPIGKAYIAVFICCTIKAVHLEVTSDLSSETFIAALDRFLSRRGNVKHIYSDNGTTFVGTNNSISNLNRIVQMDKTQSFLLNNDITWHFIPPRSAHFGGLWEAMVKSVKYHLKRINKEMVFSFEELVTLTTSIEGVLNSRPITPLSDDPNDPTPLTPGLLLNGAVPTNIIKQDFTTTPDNRLTRWQMISKLLQNFWIRWKKDYLCTLQQRTKWQKSKPNIKLNTIVLIVDENLPPTRWMMGRVIETHPGDDQRIRVVSIRTKNGIFKRAITKICPLPINTPDEVQEF